MMNLRIIAIRNLLRRKAKAALVLSGLVIGVSTVVGIIGFVDAMTADINQKLEKFGANILIVPKTENLPLSYGGLSLGGVSFEMQEIRQVELERVKQIENASNIAALGPLVLGVIEVNGNKVLMAGVDFATTRVLKPWWHVGGNFPGRNGVLLGAEAARVLHMAPGSRIRIRNYPLTVEGVLQPTGSQDDHLVFAQLESAQAIFDKSGRISMAEVAALCKDCPIEDMVRQISAVLPGAKVMAIQQVVKGRMETLAQFRQFSFGVSVVILIIGSLVVFVTMMGSVRERTDEIGIFRAVGFRKRHIMCIVLMEAGTISVLAGIIGYLLGWGATKTALIVFSRNFSSDADFSPELAVAAILTSLLVGLLSSAYPAVVASRLDPNDALRAL